MLLQGGLIWMLLLGGLLWLGAAAVAAAGIVGLLAAGRRLLAGDLDEAEHAGRRAAGIAAPACLVVALPSLWLGLASMRLMPGGGMALLLAGGAALAASASCLLGGLSGKPVPAAWFAAALLVVAVALAAVVVLTAGAFPGW